jgi:uncharacterized damage-inducible protein DinB
MPRPAETDAISFALKYIQQVQCDSVKEATEMYPQQILDFYVNLPEDKADYAYADGKWTIKEVLQHVIDAERVFVYRALRISRKDTAPLASFNENEFAQNSNATARTLASLKEEFAALRKSTDIFLSHLTDEQYLLSGTASNHYATVNAIGFIIYGHMLHHIQILKERYL